ncbi:helicase-associated domain-containing protein [Microaerobacter geothermalis]|uniref:helicase-associated domain-containing protein n=1 Tax=Microaerobacter geothermalis TaxID=674972 RepID=UPI001F43D527|nr:helicase-associated domain-containing protein [Microaerobacter geothermalis]MCF6094216.1 helicase-associated domain-containing protein [Microaerobacter geothermalis]
MRLREVLSQLSSETADQLISFHGKKFLQEIYEEKNLLDIYRRLGEVEKNILHFFFIYIGNGSLSEREKDMWQGCFPHSHFRYGLTTLRQKGLVFTQIRPWGEKSYHIPLEIREAILKDGLKEAGLGEASSDLSRNRGGKIGPHHRLFLLLSELSKEKVKLTSQGKLSKGWMERLERMNGLQESAERLEVSIKAIPPFLKQEWLEKHFVLIALLSYAWSMEFLKEEGGYLGTDETNVVRWLKKTEEEMVYSFIQWYSDDFFNGEPMIQSVIVGTYTYQGEIEINRVSQLLENLPAGVSGNHVKSLDTFLRLFKELGLISWENGDHFYWIKWPDQIKFAHDGHLYVQPNFDILFSCHTPFSIWWEVAQLAKLQTLDLMIQYGLDPSSICHVLDKGWTGEEIHDFLESEAKIPLPESVSQFIKDWSHRYGEVSFFEGVVMSVRTKRLANELEILSEISPYLVEKISDTHYLISKSHWETMMKGLEKKGYLPRKQIIPVGEGETKDKEHIASEEKAVYPIQIEDTIPTIEDEVPELKEVPVQWFSPVSRFHGHTLKEMAGRSRGLQFPLRMHGERGVLHLIPNEVWESHHGIWIQGKDENGNEVMLNADDIKAIQMILPRGLS